MKATQIFTLFSITCILGLGLALTGPCLAAGPRWIGGLATMNDPRQEIAVAMLDGKIYVAGGLRADGSATNSMEVYDPWTNSWATMPPIPIVAGNVALVVNNNKLYAIGGIPAVNGLYAYDPPTRQWTALAEMPTPRGGLGAAAINGKIYAVGGVNNDGVLDQLMVYDPVRDSWSQLASMPTPRYNMAIGAINGKLYVVGGRVTDDLTFGVVEAYDPATDTWTTPSAMPTGRSDAAYAVFNDELYVFGGEGNRGHPDGVFNVTEIYNPTNNRWRTGPPMITARHGAGAALVGEKIYLPGGASRQGLGVARVNEVYVSGTGNLHFPHVATGGGISTELIITNFSDAQPAVGVLEFFNQNGDATTLIIDGQNQSAVNFSIAPYGAATIRADAPPNAPIRTVYAVATSDNPVNGSVIFRNGASTAGVGAGTVLRRFITPVQAHSARQINTGLALLNIGGDSTDLTLTLRNENGQVLGTTTLTMDARHQTARFITDLFPNVNLSDFRGTLVGSSGGSVAGVSILVTRDQFASFPLRGE